MQVRRALGGVRCGRRRRLAERERAQELADPAAPAEADRVTRSDSIDPGRQLRLAAKARQAAVDGDEHVLRGVLPLLQRDAERADETVHRGRMAVVQYAPRCGVAHATTLDELIVGNWRAGRQRRGGDRSAVHHFYGALEARTAVLSSPKREACFETHLTVEPLGSERLLFVYRVAIPHGG